ncbi:serine/threonine-protein phosphatase 6 regulatory ankyrin repeat subunit A-like [Microplitis mediator]|uniref:serine/threonine-protein phosphatase 6 regulatory ankyrin repeat subunit A-like n=1 Tax=Microplitis mediator TaxID=375433 RepID=UPI00255492A4|nr:serine/threonine-protein phosphatase 6 regulatory ankyrin repeat subunit A-like [Microplitis mediator]
MEVQQPITFSEYKTSCKEIRNGQRGVNTRLAFESFGIISILHIALYFEDYSFVEYLLDHQVDVNVNEESCGTPLHFAIIQKVNYRTIQKLLEVGANVNAEDNEKFTPLHRAVHLNRYKIAELLLEFGANINATCDAKNGFDFWTPLDLAIIGDKLEMVMLLLSCETDINLKLQNGRYPPLVIACLYGSVRAIEIILEKGADINYSSDSGLITELPLQAAVVSGDHYKVRLLLSNSDIKINQVNIECKTALHYAVSSPSEIILKNLLDAGIDVNVVDRGGRLAVESNNRDSGKKKIIILKKHIVKLSVAGYCLAEGNLKAISDEEYDNLRKKCSEEIEVLKSSRIDSINLSFYSVLCKNEHVLARRLKRVDEEIKHFWSIYRTLLPEK